MTTGYTYTTTGTNTMPSITTGTGLTWISNTGTNPTYSISQEIKGTSLKVNGDAEFLGDIKIKNKSLSEQLDKIEERLGILHPNLDLEERWKDLKRLRQEYLELEKEILEKEKMWAILKK